MNNKQNFNEEENFQNETNFSEEEEISKEELAQALSFYIGGQVGISEEISSEEAGRLGAFLSDLIEIMGNALFEKLAEEIINNLITEAVISYWFSPIVNRMTTSLTIEVTASALEMLGAQPAAQFLRNHKEFINSFLKNLVTEPVKRVSKKLWSTAKVFIKNVLA